VNLSEWLSEWFGCVRGTGKRLDVDWLLQPGGATKTLWIFDGVERAEPGAREFVDALLSSSATRDSMGIHYALFSARQPIAVEHGASQLFQWTVAGLHATEEKLAVVRLQACLEWISKCQLDELTSSPVILRLLLGEFAKTQTTSKHFVSDILHAVLWGLLSRGGDESCMAERWTVLARLGYETYCLKQPFIASTSTTQWMQDCCFLRAADNQWAFPIIPIFFAAVYISRCPPHSLRGYRDEFPGLLSSLVTGLVRRSAPSPQYDALCAVLCEEDASSSFDK